MTRDRTLGVGELAELAGVTVRALHHYDDVGLLRPKERSVAGYRRYCPADLHRLQAILIYRELGFGLVEIAAALDGGPADRVALLERQRELLIHEQIRTQRIVAAIDAAIRSERTGARMSPEEMFEVFGDFDPKEHEKEAAERWPDAFKLSQQRTSGYSAEQWKEAIAQADSISQRFAELLAGDEPPGAVAAMDLAEEHRLSIDRWYYPCSKQMHAGLGGTYLADPRFFEHWENYGEGVAQFVHDAIVANAARSE